MPVLKKVSKLAGDFWMILGITLLMLVIIECGFSLGFYLRSFWHTPYVDERVNADAYTDTSWVPSYYKEHEQLGKPRWRSYVYWRRKPNQGKNINLNSEGIRRTYNAAASKGGGASLKIFMFGGSTMFGSGERDDFTIPSLLSKEAEKRGLKCEVINFGQEAYVSTQEVIELVLQLQKGNIPGAVIFYDGVNDTFGGYQLGVAGLPHNEFNREMEFNLLEKSENRMLAVQSTVKQLSTIRFFTGVFKRLGLRHESFQMVPLQYEKPISDKGDLARAVVESYLGNVRLVQALSKSYGFKCLFYWQPTIFQKKQLTKYERKAEEIENRFEGMEEFYVKTYAVMQERITGLKNDLPLHDISSIFNDVTEPLYLDLCHLSERGNNQIAKKMIEDLLQLMAPKGGRPINGDVVTKVR